MGASLGFELARRFEARGVVPTCVFASGRRAPSRYRAEFTHRLDDNGLIAEIRSLNGTDAGILDDEDVLRMVLPAIRADYRAAETYRREADVRVACPIVALAGESDAKASLDEVRAWAGHTTGPFRMHTYRGGHFFLNANVAAVTDLLREQLEAARTGVRAPGDSGSPSSARGRRPASAAREVSGGRRRR
jgi:surfactin synthase thioesterase subunit